MNKKRQLKRIHMYSVLRKLIKKQFVRFIRKVLETNTFQEEIFNILDDQRENHRIVLPIEYRESNVDYPELGLPEMNITNKRNDIIFITARFRSGSTFLWNIFRNIPGCVAYYEPLIHEGPKERGAGRQFQIDPTHLGVEDYHSEFRSITGLDEVHKTEWSFAKLKMDEYYFAPELERYINLLIENAKGRPILQFNRVDFRLQWLKAHYPNAKTIHLYRNPRDQWMSMIKNDCYIPKEFKWDKEDTYPPINTFYLFDWWKDLHFQMPFLSLDYLEHPYQIHYLIWRLSYLFGRQFSDISIRYETLIDSFEEVMRSCFQYLGIKDYDMNKLKLLVNFKNKSIWKEYANDLWFKKMESKSEKLLSSFFRPKLKKH